MGSPNYTYNFISALYNGLDEICGFAVFKILHNLVSTHNVLNAGISKIWKTLLRDLIFIFDVLLRSAISFVSFFVP